MIIATGIVFVLSILGLGIMAGIYIARKIDKGDRKGNCKF